MSSNSSLSVLSPCHKYVASVSENRKSLSIHALQSQSLHRSYDITTSLKNHLVRNGIEKGPRISVVKFSQLTWEHVLPGSEASKIGVVIDNYAILLIYDIRSDQGQTMPIIIQQPRCEGIESFQWIPPPEVDDDSKTDTGGYVNSKQFAVFTKMNLHMKLYSVDCTHILFTILKPIRNAIAIRPNKQNRFWSILATPIEYNAPSLLYHFHNEGSISSLLQTHKLSTNLITDPVINWSVSGNWFSLLDSNTNLFGLDLNAYGFVVTFEPNKIPNLDPVMSIDYLNEGAVEHEGRLEVGNTDYFQSWFQIDNGSEYVLVVSVNESEEITFLIYSIGLLRLIHRQVIKHGHYKEGWLQVADKNHVSYKRNSSISLKGSSLNSIKVHESKAYLWFHSTILVFDIQDVKHSQLNLMFKTSIQCSSNVLDLIVAKEGYLTVATDTHVLEYEFDSNSISVPYQNVHLKVKQAYCGDEEIIVMNESINRDELSFRNWELIKRPTTRLPGQENRFEAIRPFKRQRPDTHRMSLLASNHSFTNDEITDTFNQRKRSKRLE